MRGASLISATTPQPGLVARLWCLECPYELELSEAEAEEGADRGVPWRMGTE